MCILYYVGPNEDKFPEHPWLTTGLEELAHNYALEMNGKVFSKELVTPTVRMPYSISADDRKALDAVEAHTNLMMANRKAGKAGTLPGGYDGATEGPHEKAQLAGSRKTSHSAPDTETLSVQHACGLGIISERVKSGIDSEPVNASPTGPLSVFPLNELDGLRIQIATLEERIKDMTFELNDKDITITELEREIAKLTGGV